MAFGLIFLRLTGLVTSSEYDAPSDTPLPSPSTSSRWGEALFEAASYAPPAGGAPAQPSSVPASAPTVAAAVPTEIAQSVAPSPTAAPLPTATAAAPSATAASPAAQGPPNLPPNSVPQDFRTFVTLHINTIDEGETPALIRGSDVLIPVSALDRANVHGLPGTREQLFGEPYVSLGSLAPDVTFTFDVNALALDVTIAPSHLNSRTSIDLHTGAPEKIQYTGGTSGYINYALATASGGNDSAFFDSALVNNQNSLHFTLTAQSDNPLRRDLTYYEMDDRVAETSTVLGDLNASTGDLGGSQYIAGIGFSRNFDLDPYAIHYPLPSLSGLITSPSVANVYVNGVLVQRVNLQPGAFNLNNLPVTSGTANAQVVVTDAFGRSQTYSQSYYTTADILSPGTTDYQYSVGLLREDAFGPGDHYGPPAALGDYRTGVTDALTVGGRFESTPDLVSGGPSFDFKDALGYFHLALAGSDMQGFTGAATSIGYSYTTPRYGLNLSWLTQGPYYANVSQPWSEDRALTSISPSVTVQLGKSGQSLTAEYFLRAMRDSGTNAEELLSATVPLHRNYALTLEADRQTSTTSSPIFAFTATLNIGIGRKDVTLVSQSGTTPDSNVQVQETSPGRYGLDYSMLYDPPDGHSFDSSLLYNSEYGTAQGDYSKSGSTPLSDSLRLAGSLAFLGGGIFPTVPVTGAYALVDVPGAAGIHVSLENQDMGVTDGKGELLVPGLLPNYGNTLRIDDEGAAINESIQSLQKIVAPPTGAGALVKFAAERLHALTGTLIVLLHGKPVVPQYGELTLDGKVHAESILGTAGEFYLENVPSGVYQAKVIFSGGTCPFDFTAPETNDILVRMGTLRCTQP